jgi:hypothetical protein
MAVVRTIRGLLMALAICGVGRADGKDVVSIPAEDREAMRALVDELVRLG